METELAKGADVNAPQDDYGQAPLEGRAGVSALHIACHHGHAAMARVLVGKGVDVNTDHCEGRHSTALHAAAHIEHLDVVKLLLEHDADPGAKDGEGNTPLAVAKKQLAEHSEIMRDG